MREFSKALWRALFQMTYVITPLAAFLIVLRIPIVRLVFGTNIFTWESTVQTGMVVSAFAFGIISQAGAALLARGFYALHDTKTPVTVSILSIIATILLDYLFIKIIALPIWGLAAAFSTGSIFQVLTLYYLMNKRVYGKFKIQNLIPFAKHLTGSVVAGMVMYFLLKFFDKYAWIKRLSFLGSDIVKNIPFEKFVLDTRYTINILILTAIVSAVGTLIYLGVTILLKTEEVISYFNLIKRFVVGKSMGGIPEKERELISIPPTDGSE